MNKTGVKICGLQSVEVLKSMVNLPVDYIGFVFADSKRRIDGAHAGELLRVLDEWTPGSRPRSVGVFVNPSDALLNDVMEKAPLDVIQLHGQESPQRCRELKERFGMQVFKAWSVDSQGQTVKGKIEYRADELEAYVGTIDALLLDTYDPLYGGGSGKTFAWDRIPAYQAWTHQHGIPLFVAGGLTADNAEKLINEYHPEGLDVSSGVETNGVKDIAKITAFVERVKQA
ncbi:MULTISPECIES: phosphoribosylanthranilate isomerase [Paenibacillus]|uniref:phosphoribosylanthranilate isomerase n=1 Tax=Paenibacillus TaxID=44249 RepID=UPI00058A5423|nr:MULTISPECIES: phosphoribosylanthranilate isomerase [Paenibacillus]AJE53569.1 N-(5'-phosphoribosyl)anthranilate isomerase [Paenibacillus polymyxa]AZH29964.1 phosphoribosylanthranilate isomerase [Paenibacillus sp. M-152]MBU9706721.1 phosphoribosylanthranilate isomerase [Paenibacillus sp. AK121]QOH62582.1 phosphoribosylanthranilate isomerase [Paenibacillus polymyxa]